MSFTESEARQVAANFDLRKLPPEFYDDPVPYYDALREHEPIKKLPDGTYFVSRYKDLVAIYKDAATFSSAKDVEFKPKLGDTPIYQHFVHLLAFNDAPTHTRIRRLLAGALTPKHIAAMQGNLEQRVDKVLNGIAAKNEIDLIVDYADLIPVETICAMFGIEDGNIGSMKEWARSIFATLDPIVSPEEILKANVIVAEAEAFVADLLTKRRAALRDPEIDILSRLIVSEEGDEPIDAKALLHNSIFLLTGGHEATTNLIGNGLMLLTSFPEEKAKLIAHPDLIKTAVEEFLRFDSTNQFGNRITTRATDIAGIPLPPQTSITLGIGAANRDPEQFENPNVLNIERSPNRHLGFGFGVHQCVGMNLGRLQVRLAVSRFLERFPNFSVTGEPTRNGRARFRAYAHVPMKLLLED